MPRVPSISPTTGNPTSSSFIHTADCQFVDNAGRTLLLRGVNLSGSAKAPVDKPSWMLDGFWDDAEEGSVSFVGRPLNLDDGSADVHLARLRGWGFNMLRFPVTWEALEHAGPGKFDDEFMDYTVRVLRRCKDFGFLVYMDPHQDIWSRFSGGSGAPIWTLTACGIDPRNFTATQAAIIHAEYPTAQAPDPASLPAMIWSTNYGRLASQTIFTLFFSGRDFAPKCIIDGKNIQDYLQEHYIEAMGRMADRIRDAGDLLEECVIGWDSMNEPFEGLCGWPDLNVNPDAQGSTLRKGTHPTPAQSLRLGQGQAQTVDNFKFGAFGPSKNGTVTIDPKGIKMWADPSIEVDGVHPKWGWRRDPGWKLGTCIWAEHGVWDVESGYILIPEYFRHLRSTLGRDEPPEEAEFITDYWRPHWEAFTARIRESHPESIMFVQPPVFAVPPSISEELLKGRAAYSGHYYDGLTLVTRHWNWFNADALGLLRGKYSSPIQAVKIGERAIRKSLQEQLGVLKNDTLIIGQYPTIIGEIGIPYDMDDKRSYGWTDKGKYRGDYSRQERALDASLNASDGPNGISYTLWTYCADSCHDWGDGWNMEDLSLWSMDDLAMMNSSRDELGDYSLNAESQAGLLTKRKNSFNVPAAYAASALSLATLALGDRASFEGIRMAQKMELEMMRWRSNPLQFLTDGARAVRAFARPYPVKTVGVPSFIDFDIKSATFKLTVTVTSEDRLKPDGVEDKFPGTEVYIPLVQFAHPRLLPQEPKSSASSATLTREPSSPIPGDEASDRTLTLASGIWESLKEDKLLDLDVQVSAGTWAVEGQTLTWWYDVPQHGEEPKEYTLEVRRAGGPVKIKQESAPAEGWSWFENICPPESCTVM
ncbi:glycoside hydrolase family 5 protein [Cylindrobasidium torrendii FP15055 ss-10]|uniref:Glycoside hydrolase family 5 protein n=1 Tax=Cylindrobasidium torrendii FP15055 ss-10 TaxID=1314674 RepID=A0A0D7BNZ0_9AGAR|nr:glycoside hydrolase family 5 protein [Cylindrobasidium torrendii FP15055 ss-10]